MSITASDLEFRYSAPAASAGGQLAQADPSASLGGCVASTPWLGGAKHDLFARVTGDDNANMIVEYRCLFIVNKHATLTWTAPVLWFPTSVTGGAAHALGVDPTPASALGADAPQALTVSAGRTAPTGVTFATPTSKGAGVAVGNLPPGTCRAFWVRRSAFNTAAAANDGCNVRAEGDTT